MLVQRAFLSSRKPSHIEAKARMASKQLQETLALEDAGARVGDRFDPVEQRIFHRALQTDHVAWKQKVDDLPAPVLESLESEHNPLQEGIEMRAYHPLREHLAALGDIYFALLKICHELDLGGGQGTKPRLSLQRTIDARNDRAFWLFEAHWQSDPWLDCQSLMRVLWHNGICG